MGGKIQIIQSLLLTDKISINSRYRLKKVRTNIAVVKREKKVDRIFSHCMASNSETDYTYCSER